MVGKHVPGITKSIKSSSTNALVGDPVTAYIKAKAALDPHRSLPSIAFIEGGEDDAKIFNDDLIRII
jgi:hypothetical protein